MTGFAGKEVDYNVKNYFFSGKADAIRSQKWARRDDKSAHLDMNTAASF